MVRRRFLTALLAAAGVLLAGVPSSEAGPRQRRRRRRRRRVRRRVRRRHRRRVVYRTIRGRRAWVVPVGVAVGWELVHDDRVVVVKEIRVVEVDGVETEMAVVQDVDAKEDAATEEIAIVREDTKENSAELEGSLLSDDDETTPGVETEIEEEVEDEEEDEEEDDAKPSDDTRKSEVVED